MTIWNEHEPSECGEGKIKNILMGESVVDVPTTFVSENHGYVPVHRGIDIPSSGSVAMSFGRHSSTQGFCHKSNRRGSMER